MTTGMAEEMPLDSLSKPAWWVSVRGKFASVNSAFASFDATGCIHLRFIRA
jgi:hypothetical protein